jgi:N-acetylmuramate 1-kinase
MTHQWTVSQASESDLRRIAELIALKLKPGDVIALQGNLGAGKTAFARALIRAAVGDPEAEVPSPTFSLVQTYDASRLKLAHLDLYRLTSEDETVELGVDELLSDGALLVEWPERAPALIGPDRLTLRLSEAGSEHLRRVELEGTQSWAARLHRVRDMFEFLARHPDWNAARVEYLQGDASARAYARLTGGSRPALLMDWPRQPDGPPLRDGLPYSQIAHLAEGVTAFAAVDEVLRDNGFRAPTIYGQELQIGLLLTEDFGDHVFGQRVDSGSELGDMWQAATDILVQLRSVPANALERIKLPGQPAHRVPHFDRGALTIETELLVDWYWPMLYGVAAPNEIRTAFANAWSPLFDVVLAHSPCLVLRDYHSPNLLWLPERGPSAVDKVGIIDFQDAVRGHPAYDLVSLLQDARLDVPADLEADLLQRYCDLAQAQDPQFDRGEFGLAYAALGAQRNTKILGIFARLWKRDGKPQYLRHIPRLWRYLERDLSHPGLTGLKAWFDTYIPAAQRAVPLSTSSGLDDV